MLVNFLFTFSSSLTTSLILNIQAPNNLIISMIPKKIPIPKSKAIKPLEESSCITLINNLIKSKIMILKKSNPRDAIIHSYIQLVIYKGHILINGIVVIKYK